MSVSGGQVLIGLFAIFVAGALFAWWKFINADAEGLEPTNHIDELNKEDGGPGPIP